MKENDDTPWWQFWSPQSGSIGGYIFGTLAACVAILLAEIIAKHL